MTADPYVSLCSRNLEDAIVDEAILGIKTYLPNGVRVTVAARSLLDEAIREQHIATCPFAKEHKHPVGLVEQLDNADIRIAKAKKLAEEKRKREEAEAKKKAKNV